MDAGRICEMVLQRSDALRGQGVMGKLLVLSVEGRTRGKKGAFKTTYFAHPDVQHLKRH